eukprot:246315-Hanusia_phi.AAC.1
MPGLSRLSGPAESSARLTRAPGLGAGPLVTVRYGSRIAANGHASPSSTGLTVVSLLCDVLPSPDRGPGGPGRHGAVGHIVTVDPTDPMIPAPMIVGWPGIPGPRRPGGPLKDAC